MRRTGRTFFLFLMSLTAAMTASLPAAADETFGFDPGMLDQLSQEAADDLMDAVSFGADHRSYRPASSLGMMLGFDVGASVTAIPLPGEAEQAVSAIGGSEIGTAAIPRVSAHKGLPMGVDVGLSYAGGVSGVSILGGDVQFALVRNLALPSVSFRGSFTSANLGYMSATNVGGDLLVSKNFLLIDPYIGLGMRVGSAELDFDGAPVPAVDDLSRNVAGTRLTIGAAFKLGLIRLTPEIVHNFGMFTTYGAKASVGF